MKSTWETYNGKQIFCANYDHMTIDEVKKEVTEVKAYMAQHPGNSTLVLVNAVGTIISPDVLNLFKEVAASAGTGNNAVRTALLGMSGPRKAFIGIVSKVTGNPLMPFDDMEKAKEWLTQ